MLSMVIKIISVGINISVSVEVPTSHFILGTGTLSVSCECYSLVALNIFYIPVDSRIIEVDTG